MPRSFRCISNTNRALLGLITACCLGLIISGCVGTNLDQEESIFPDFKPAVDTLNCDGRLYLNSLPFLMDDQAEAWLIVGEACHNGTVERTHNYLILLDVPPDLEDFNEPLSLPRLGFPGISFSSNGPAPLEQDLLQIGVGVFPSYIVTDYSQLGERTLVLEDDTTVKLDFLGDEVDEYVAGTLNGWLTEVAGGTTGETVAINGSFCVPITKICQ